jgi:circadian clock protein KaiC
MRRGLTVLKMRGSMHDKQIREFTIDEEGMHVGEAFRNVHGILSGSATHTLPAEIDRMQELFS